MLRSDFLAVVAKYNELIDSSKSDTYETAFFRIYVKFELYVSELFINYAIGEKSEKDYLPVRLLNFPEKDTMDKFLSIGGKRYVDYYKLAQESSNVFFQDNPFNILSESENYPRILRQMSSIRNYIAHESQESKRSYIRHVLMDNSFIEPGDFLKSEARGISPKKTNYSLYIEKMVEISDLLLESSLL